MKFIYTVIILVCCFGVQLQAQSNEGQADLRVVGGNTVDAEEYPWVVALVSDFDESFCGASLIHPSWVLTAAHCIGTTPSSQNIDRVIINSIVNNPNTLEPFSELIEVEEIFIHEDYVSGSGGGGPDIALMKLVSPSNTTPVALASMNDLSSFAHGMPANIVGWGKTVQGGQGVETLRHADCYFIDGDTCKTLYESSIFPSFYERNLTGSICAGYFVGQTQVGAAQGDSGGPLFYKNNNGISKQVGIVSGGEHDVTTVDFPGVYTLVPQYRSWIDSVLMENGDLIFTSLEQPEENIITVIYANQLVEINNLRKNNEYLFQIYDMSGRLISNSKIQQSYQSHQMSILDYNKGIYVLRIINLSKPEERTQVKKFIVN